MRMKRTNLVLDEHLLSEALKISGKSTYSAMVNEALGEYCRLRRVEEIYTLKGSGIWEGDLGEMRNDYTPKVKDKIKIKREKK
jgi:Arc/MetJ family transcription regulator